MARFLDVLLPILGGLAGASSPQAARGLVGAAGIAGDIADRRRREQEQAAQRASSMKLGDLLRVQFEQATGGQYGPYDKAALGVLEADPGAGADLLMGRLRQIQSDREDEAARARREAAAEAKRANDEQVEFLSRPDPKDLPRYRPEVVLPHVQRMFGSDPARLAILTDMAQRDPDRVMNLLAGYEKTEAGWDRSDRLRAERETAAEAREAEREAERDRRETERERAKAAAAQLRDAESELERLRREIPQLGIDAAQARSVPPPVPGVSTTFSVATYNKAQTAVQRYQAAIQRMVQLEDAVGTLRKQVPAAAPAAAPAAPAASAPASPTAPSTAGDAYAPTPEEVRKAMR